MFDWIRGLHAPAWLVGFVRGLVEAAVFAIIAFGIAWLGGTDVPDGLLPWAPTLILGLRTLEGFADQIDPQKKRAP